MLYTFATGMIDLHFRNGNRAQALSLSDANTSVQALDLMGLADPRPALVIIGGASLMSAESLDRLQTIFDQVFAPLAQDLGLSVLDGGTDAGVIHMMGRARQHVGGGFPLIGVVPQGKTRLPRDHPAADDSRHDLEPNHTSFFLIPGDKWGSESPWLAEFASQISAGHASLTILINGGKVALTDLKANLATDRPAIVLSGSGRLADAIAAAMNGAEAEPHILELVQHYQPDGRLDLVDMSTPTEQLRDRLQHYFTPTP